MTDEAPPPSPDSDALFTTPSAGGEGTRNALVRVAIDLFGRKGYDATSTRDIAGAAGVNIAGIAYHFGGKGGLHRVCAEAIAGFLSARIGEFAAGVDDVERMTPEAAEAAFVAAVTGLARFMLSRPEAESVARFVVREQMDPTATFDILYAVLFRPRHERLCRLWARATGEDAASEKVIVSVSAVLGQVMFFRVGRATALRRLGWETIDAERCERIVETVVETIRATMASRRSRIDVQ
jgi:TetR/AcrR family transcriptional regulator, regulator of cefoperazone and chloramphenicol sensitivity